jgi:serine/threonine protein kinase
MPKHNAVPIKHEHGFTINGCTFHVDPKYKPLDAIGQGSYGVVCSVLNTLTKEKVAIKKITPMAGDEWDATHTLREIRLMRCLGEHENVCSSACSIRYRAKIPTFVYIYIIYDFRP